MTREDFISGSPDYIRLWKTVSLGNNCYSIEQVIKGDPLVLTVLTRVNRSRAAGSPKQAITTVPPQKHIFRVLLAISGLMDVNRYPNYIK
jgi:hypothetical protein